MSKPRVVTSEKDAPMVLHGAEKKMAEDNTQARFYHQGKAQERRLLLNSEFGGEIKALLKVLGLVTPDSGEYVIGFLEHRDWFKHLAQRNRDVILGMINDEIMRQRTIQGLSPINDSLPGEDPTLFEICREKLK